MKSFLSFFMALVLFCQNALACLPFDESPLHIKKNPEEVIIFSEDIKKARKEIKALLPHENHLKVYGFSTHLRDLETRWQRFTQTLGAITQNNQPGFIHYVQSAIGLEKSLDCMASTPGNVKALFFRPPLSLDDGNMKIQWCRLRNFLGGKEIPVVILCEDEGINKMNHREGRFFYTALAKIKYAELYCIPLESSNGLLDKSQESMALLMAMKLILTKNGIFFRKIEDQPRLREYMPALTRQDQQIYHGIYPFTPQEVRMLFEMALVTGFCSLTMVGFLTYITFMNNQGWR